MVLGAGIERLRHDHGTDDDTEYCAGKQRGTCAGAEQPERTAAAAEFGWREHLYVVNLGVEGLQHRRAIRVRLEADDQAARTFGERAGVVTGILQVDEYVGRCGEGADAVGERNDLDATAADLRRRSDAGDAEPVEIGAVDDDGAR